MNILSRAPLSEVAEIFVGLARNSKGFSHDENRPPMRLIGMKALEKSGLDFNAIETAYFAPGFDCSAYQIAPHDVLIACRAPEIRVALAPPEAAGAVLDANVMALRCGPRLAPRLLAAYLQHPAGRAVLERASQSTTTQKNLTIKAVKKILIPLPPIEAQVQAVQLLEIAERQYHFAVLAAERRVQIAQQIAVNTLYRGNHDDPAPSATDHS